MGDFKQAFAFVMEHEDASRSGRVTVDAGGRTRFGIAERFHPELREEFFTGPADEALAEAERMEERDYWGPMRLAEVENQDVANKLFDMAVNMGVRQAGVYAQRAANFLLRGGPPALLEDGVMGEKTLAGINQCVPMELHRVLCELSEAHYRHVAAVNPAQAVNLQGWLKRAAA